MDSLTDAEQLQLLEQNNPILQVAVELGIKVRGNMGKCFRTEAHAGGADELTLFFNLAENSFFCKTCTDVGGDVIDLVCQYQGWERNQAIDWLNHRIEFDRQTKKMYYQRGKRK
jgi:hypothetical protein